MFKRKVMMILRKVPKVLGIILLVSAVLFVGFQLFLSIYFKPHDVRLTNVTDTSFTVSWITNYPMRGIVYYKEKDSILPGILSWIGTKRAYDDRDIAWSQRECVEKFNKEAKVSEDFVVDSKDYDCNVARVVKFGRYYVHHVTLTNLDENKEYSFRVGDGLFSRKMDMNRSATFFSLKSEVKAPAPIFGSIVNEKGDSINDSVVYIKFVNGFLNKESMYYSAVTASDGSWYLDGNNIRTIEGEPIIVENGQDTIKAYAQYENYVLSDAHDWVYGNGDFAYPDIVVKDSWEKDLSALPNEENGIYVGLVKGVLAKKPKSNSGKNGSNHGNKPGENSGKDDSNRNNKPSSPKADLVDAIMQEKEVNSNKNSTQQEKDAAKEKVQKATGDYEKAGGKALPTRSQEIKKEEEGCSGCECDNSCGKPVPTPPKPPEVTSTCQTSNLAGCTLEQLTDKNLANTIGIGYVMNELKKQSNPNGKIVKDGKQIDLLEAYQKLGLCKNAVACAGNFQAAGISKDLRAGELICPVGQKDCNDYLFRADGTKVAGSYIVRGGPKGVIVKNRTIENSVSLQAESSSSKATSIWVNIEESPNGSDYIAIIQGRRYKLNPLYIDTKCRNEGKCRRKMEFSAFVSLDSLLRNTGITDHNKALIRDYLERQADEAFGKDNKFRIGNAIYLERDAKNGLYISGRKTSTILVTKDLVKVFPNIKMRFGETISWDHLNQIIKIANKSRYGIDTSAVVLVVPNSKPYENGKNANLEKQIEYIYDLCKEPPCEKLYITYKYDETSKKVSFQVWQDIRWDITDPFRLSKDRELDMTYYADLSNILSSTIGKELEDFYSKYSKEVNRLHFEDSATANRYDARFMEVVTHAEDELRKRLGSCSYDQSSGNWSDCMTAPVVEESIEKDLCTLGKGSWSDSSMDCDFTVKGVTDAVLGTRDSKDNSLGSGYITYLPEYGFFDMEIEGLKETEKVEGNTLRIFYVETNGVEGFQPPADPDNPKKTEDIMLQSNSLNISYKKSAEVMTLDLKRGVNLVSFNYIPKIENNEYSKASSILKWLISKGARVEHISYFSGGRWKGIGYVDGKTTGDDFNITPGKGYLIYTEADAKVNIPGYKITSSVPVPLGAGWNLIGVHGYNEMYTARSLIDSINSIDGLTANNVSWWPTSKGKYEGLQVVDGKQYGFDFSISSNNGYFVRISKFAPKDSKCKSLLWHAGGTHNGACGGSK